MKKINGFYSLGLTLLLLTFHSNTFAAELNAPQQVIQETSDLLYDIVKKDKDKLIPICNCSGFEKFAIAIAIRLAIAKIHPFNSMNCLFIDEGFGVFDQQNLKKLPDMLETLKPLFRQIFIINNSFNFTIKTLIFLSIKKTI